MAAYISVFKAILPHLPLIIDSLGKVSFSSKKSNGIDDLKTQIDELQQVSHRHAEAIKDLVGQLRAIVDGVDESFEGLSGGLSEVRILIAKNELTIKDVDVDRDALREEVAKSRRDGVESVAHLRSLVLIALLVSALGLFLACYVYVLGGIR